MPTATINEIRMHYQQKGQGPDVVLIHGVTGNLALWYLNILPRLPEGYRVTVYDLRGHGHSEVTPTGYTSAAMAEDLHALLEHLEIEKAFLVGHSFGGVIALHYAVLHPERAHALLPMDAGVPALRYLRSLEDWPGWELWKEQLARRGISPETFNDDPERVIRRSFEVPIQFGFRKGESRNTKRMERLLNETSIVTEFREVAGLTTDKLCQIQQPTLATYGATSPYLKIGYYLQENLPHGAVYTLPEAGHFYIMQKPDAFLELLDRFLRDPMHCVSEKVGAPAEAYQKEKEN